MKKLLSLIFATLCFTACENAPEGSMNKVDYVDLGLSSGTKWNNINEMNPNDITGFYIYSEAKSLFEDDIPTDEQWWELVNECEWTWMGSGYKIVGPNGNFITLPAAGYSYNGTVENVGSIGVYWSSPIGEEDAWVLYIDSINVDVVVGDGFAGHTVRLVH